MSDTADTKQPENAPGEQQEELVCRCPETYPEEWVGKDIDFAGWCVHRFGIASFAHMPLAYEAYVDRQADNIRQLGLTEKWPGLVLTRTGWWGGEIIRFVEDAQSASRFVEYLAPPFDVNVALHEGGVGSITKTVQEQQRHIVDAGCRPKELYLAHLSCPVCAERKGGEKILAIRRWIASKALQARVKKR